MNLIFCTTNNFINLNHKRKIKAIVVHYCVNNKIYFLIHLQIMDLKPATSYIFVIRSENSNGLSIPSKPTPVTKTLGIDNSVIPPSELAAARSFLSGKVN